MKKLCSYNLNKVGFWTVVSLAAALITPNGALAQDMAGLKAELGANARAAHASVVTFNIDEYEIEDQANLEEKILTALKAELQQYVGRDKGVDDAVTARRAAQKFLDREKSGAYTVTLPEQTLTDNKVRIVIVRAVPRTVGNIAAQGTTSYNQDNIIRSLPSLKSGLKIDVGDLRTELLIASLNPLKQTRIVLVPTGESQVDIKLSGNAPIGRVSAYGSMDNFGPVGDRARFGFGLVNANVTGSDDVFSINALTSTTPSRMWAVSGSYSVPLYNIHSLLEFSGSHSETDSGQVSIFSINGSGTVARTKMTYFLGRVMGANTSINFAYEFRRGKNNVLLTAAPQFGSLVPSASTAPLTIGTNLSWASSASGLESLQSKSVANLGVRLSKNFAGNFGASSEKLLSKLRKGSGDSTVIGANFSARINIKDWIVAGGVGGQWTNDVLIPMDQIGIAGPYAVRGFTTASVLGDSGYVANLEVSTPNLLKDSGLRLYSFVDYGGLERNKPLAGELQKASIGSFGTGLRLSISDSFTIDAYWAHKFKGQTYDADKRSNTAWVSLSARF